MAGFFEAVALMERIGMVRAGEWAETKPGYVDLGTLRSRVREMGLDLWLTRLAEDLADEALSPEMMTGFPHAHGGIVSVSMDLEANHEKLCPSPKMHPSIFRFLGRPASHRLQRLLKRSRSHHHANRFNRRPGNR